jgi:hypothetical protein
LSQPRIAELTDERKVNLVGRRGCREQVSLTDVAAAELEIRHLRREPQDAGHH